MKKILAGLAAVAAMIILAGCVSTDTLTVKINSLASPTVGYGKSYFVENADKLEGEAGLQFNEFANMVERALAAKGFVRLPMSLKDSADMAVKLGYTVSEPKTVAIVERDPIYGDVGISKIEKKDNEVVFHRERGVIGYDKSVRYETYYTYTVTVEARDAMAERTGAGVTNLWKTILTATTQSSDMRTTFPKMIAAGGIYMGLDSGRELTVDIEDNDPRLMSVLPAPTPLTVPAGR